MSNDLSDAPRAIARRDELRFNDRGQLVPVDQIENPEPDESGEQTELHAGGSGDGGRGNEIAEHQPSPPTFADALRRAAGGY